MELFPSGALGIADPAHFGACGAMVVTALITLLYVFQRRIYILQWACGWILLTGALAAAGRTDQNAITDLLLLGLSCFLSLTSILAIASSAIMFQNRRWLDRRYLFGLMPVLAWCIASPLVFEPKMALLPGYLLAAALLVAGGITFLRVLKHVQLLGTRLTGVVLLLAAVTQAWIGVAVARSPTGTMAAELMIANGLLFVFAALGLHLLVFEKMTCELRIANKRLQETQIELRELAITDALTGCHNRHFFHEVIGRELQRHQRYDVPLAFLFVDIDRFKMVNDTLGHEAGDRLIEYVSLFLKRNVRETDYVFRWGGDEFLLLLSCEFDEAQTKAAALTSSFRVALETSEMPSSVGLSVGCSEVLAHTDDIMQLIREADQAMYRNKNKSPSPITSRVKQIGENQPPPIRLVSSPLGHNLPARTRASVSRDTNNASRVNRSPYMTISKEVRDR